MTAIFYPDCEAISPSRRYTLESRSPHNGTIAHRNGRMASHDEFGFKYRTHQSEFRYRLLDNGNRRLLRHLFRGESRRVVWERWQGREEDEDSPHELVVSDDGWSVIRTHGFRPEVIVVSPAGQDTIRVQITGTGSEHRERPRRGSTPVCSWSPERLVLSTAGLYWSEHSWPYFLKYAGRPFFSWRTAWGQRLVLDLAEAAAVSDGLQLPSDLARALDDEEKREVAALLGGLSLKTDEVGCLLSGGDREEINRHPLVAKLRRVSAALHLVVVHRMQNCLPYLREWEGIDLPSLSKGSTAMPQDWWLETQLFRPIVHHALKVLGEEPLGLPTYHFTDFEDNTRCRFLMPERVPNRAVRAAQLNREMTAEQVLQLLGCPDFVKERMKTAGPPYRYEEDWEYDFRIDGRWMTLRLTWEEEDRRSRITDIKEVPPYWLETNAREAEYLWP